jgi:hypothetical protein
MAEAYSLGAKEPAAQSHLGPFNRARSDYYGSAPSSGNELHRLDRVGRRFD